MLMMLLAMLPTPMTYSIYLVVLEIAVSDEAFHTYELGFEGGASYPVPDWG